MIPTQTAEYALRALAYLATRPPQQGALRARDLSRETGIPAHYASKVLRRLVAAGILRGQKGHGGGFTLAKPLEEVRFEEILAASDSWLEPDRCAFGWGACDGVHPCPLHGTWSELKSLYEGWARSSTLAGVRDYAASVGASTRPAPRAKPRRSRAAKGQAGR